ncbi:MAG: NAD(P)/FAD-dependent oxidoreductase [Actinobacteria bacterium]|nr:NAD(P)/FAD-dependent oxidoreductase [Actinomycetota bacterium]MCL5882818.1 NAD(P)/FAD-dependent oxidoreductase [Actinomycetota bacterium]
MAARKKITKSDYDVIIVGAGPAGIFAALELTRHDSWSVLLIEKGLDIGKRKCPARGVQPIGCEIGCHPCSITCGWGGAGAFSDGKLTLSPEVGGWLSEYVGRDGLEELIAYVDRLWVEYGAPGNVHGTDHDKVEEIRQRAMQVGLRLVDAPIRHVGTDRCPKVLSAMRDDLSGKVEVATRTTVKKILVDDGEAAGVELEDGQAIRARVVIVAPGREGNAWIFDEARELGLGMINNPVDIGLRVEVPSIVMEPLTSVLYESKLLYYSKSFEDEVRTFCMNPEGFVSREAYGDVVTVNGHSYSDRQSGYTNFALLVSTRFTEPFKEPIAYGKSIARLANLLGEDIIIQRLGDLQIGQRTTEERLARSTIKPTLAKCTPGDLSFVLPFRHLRDILDMLETMDELVPGVNSRETLLYGVEVKFYSARLELTNDLETRVKNLFAVGDGAGVTRGLVQASASGVIAARAAIGRL